MAESPEQDDLAALSAQIKRAEERSNPSLKNQDDKSPSRVQAMARVMRIGADFVTTILAGLGLGWFADTQMETAPWCMISFLLIGCVIAFWNLIRATEARRASKP